MSMGLECTWFDGKQLSFEGEARIKLGALVGKLPYDVNKTLTCFIIEGNDFLLFLLEKN
ncbi:MAG TPA: hypothetical protein VNX68_12100 [Nitrosopumilaceae archaeon]|jgi:hypothetical protein|nr:hypothetical protein [Nitrosopumilaceae archaeon]